MLSFRSFLSEGVSGKNLHLDHLDEIHLLTGTSGALKALEYLDDVIETLGKGTINATVKWDGAPALFAGHDPVDGKFFLGTKSVFNKIQFCITQLMILKHRMNHQVKKVNF